MSGPSCNPSRHPWPLLNSDDPPEAKGTEFPFPPEGVPTNTYLGFQLPALGWVGFKSVLHKQYFMFLSNWENAILRDLAAAATVTPYNNLSHTWNFLWLVYCNVSQLLWTLDEWKFWTYNLVLQCHSSIQYNKIHLYKILYWLYKLILKYEIPWPVPFIQF